MKKITIVACAALVATFGATQLFASSFTSTTSAVAKEKEGSDKRSQVALKEKEGSDKRSSGALKEKEGSDKRSPGMLKEKDGSDKRS